MKKIKKSLQDSDRLTNSEKLKAYHLQADSILQNKGQNTLRAKSFSPLASIVPLAAVALTPLGINAQCGVAVFTPSNVLDSDASIDMQIDVDGDGTTDFLLDPQTNSLFLKPINGAEVIANPVGGYFYVDRLNAGDVISSANPNWKKQADLPSGAATMDYNNVGGEWNGAGTITGYVGIRIDGNRLGFMEIAWNDDGAVDQVVVTSSLTGVEDQASPEVTSIGASNCLILPVELVDFRADIRNGKTVLGWSTASEINNAGFEIQRSTDGSDYRKVGWVAGEINSNEELSYKFEDKTISSNIEYYYRLKQVDLDGKHEYSTIVRVIDRDASIVMLQRIYPNPVSNDHVQLTISGDAGLSNMTVDVYNAMGQVILTKSITKIGHDDDLTLDIATLSNGSYFIKLNADQQSSYQKMVVAR